MSARSGEKVGKHFALPCFEKVTLSSVFPLVLITYLSINIYVQNVVYLRGDIFRIPTNNQVLAGQHGLRVGNLLDPQFTQLPQLTEAQLLGICLGPYQARLARNCSNIIQRDSLGCYDLARQREKHSEAQRETDRLVICDIP